MKLIESFAKKSTKTASEEAKKEAKKTLIDLIPGILSVAGIVVGAIIFRGSGESMGNRRPTHSHTSITTNNYFFQEVSDETILRILEDSISQGD